MSRLLVAAFAAVGLSFAANAEPPSFEDFAKYPNVSGLSMSPEGDFIVGMIAEPGSDNQAQAVAVWDLDEEIDTSKPILPAFVTPSDGKMRLTGARALPAGKVQVSANQTWTGSPPGGCTEGATGLGSVKTFVSKTYWTDRTLKKFNEGVAGLGEERIRDAALEQCFRLNGRIGVYSTLPLEEGTVIIERYDPNAGKTEFFKVNLKTSKRTPFFTKEGPGDIALEDPRDGKVLVRQELEPLGGDWSVETYLLDLETDSFEKEPPLTVAIKNRYTMEVLARDEYTGQWYVLTDKFSDKAAIYFYDAKANKFSDEPVFAHPDFSAVDVVLGTKPHNFNVPLGFRYGDLVQRTFWIDPELRSIQEGLDAAFPGKFVNLSSSNDDYSRILFTVSEIGKPVTYLLLVDKSRVGVIGAANPWIKDEQLGSPELVYYPARDGLTIPAILTKPPGWTEGDDPVPLVVYPHGGPWARDYAYYDFTIQYLASRGVAVLQPQYRGSEGWGRSLWLAGDEEWGQKMQDDKDDGALWAVQQGIADPGRMAIMGASYGGYAAFAASVREGGPFRCAVGIMGVSNIDFFRKRVSESRIGRQVQGWTLKGLNPIEKADTAFIPILVVHGERDVRVPIAEGRNFFNRVKNSTRAEWVEIKDMPHGYPWPEHKMQLMNSTWDWLNADCGFGLK